MAKKIILLFVVAIGVVGFLNKNRILNYFKKDTRTTNSSEVKILFREDPTYAEIVEILLEKDVLKSRADIDAYVENNEVDTTNFAAGKYIILSQTQLPNLVNGFIKGENGHGISEVKVNVDFNNCRFIEDIGENISKCILADSASIVQFLKNDSVQKYYGFSPEQLPALFLPQRYEMYFDTDAEGFVAFMANEFKLFWNEERKSKMREIGLNSPSQVVTLASIVYSEQSKVAEEWPIIAGVYLNRLKKGMKLESDPTFKYCWGKELDGVERLLNKHKNRDCAYNTYLYKGLPPGPICLVPRKVIDAVLNPSESDYIFLCGKPGGGGHNFASTLNGHNANVRAYRKWLVEYLNNK